MYNDTVTVFNLYRSKQLGTATWYPHVVENCYFNTDKGANIQKTGLENADIAKLHIKYRVVDDKKMIGELEYKEPKEWDAQTNDKYDETINFATGNNVAMTLMDNLVLDKSAQERLFEFTINEYLSGVMDANGVNLLDMGKYPYRVR